MGRLMPSSLVVGVTHLVQPPFQPEMAALGGDIEVVYFNTRDEEEFDPGELQRLDVFLVWTPGITTATIDLLKNCRILVRYGVGYDKIDRQALSRAGIAFSNNPEYGPEDVADTAMAMLLGLQRKIYEHDWAARSYRDSWQENHLSPVHQSNRCTVGVVGVGRIGISVINRLKPFGYRVLGYDPYISNGLARAVGITRMPDLESLFAECDMLTLHCPLTEESRGMITSELLALSRPGLVLVNTARGNLIQGLDMIEDGLKSGQLAGVGLDVLPEEPPAPHPLVDAWRRDEDWLRGRLVITPHNAFYSDHSMAECRFQAAETARLFLAEGVHRNSVPD